MSEQPVWTDMDAGAFWTRGDQMGLFADPRGDGMGTIDLFSLDAGDEDQEGGVEGR
ncbi:hypothetical protein [Streptomyces yaizuensis]|uniref:Uncharacterized protein n=1 Tax=Streptomyces yaizuensis TaxID=2989713 RepID=A0AA86IWV4_9ACTN|nr:hypothetical protein [Streptomyces sp. YSPA8]BDT39508.1 hypothetical protein SYYSPA8_36950 [Streptomyces sp. YSPA8]